jgi:hypothetical protein
MNPGLMAYVVIVCSRCRLARGAPEGAMTATCPGCGRKLRVPELRKYHRSESLAELAEAIGQLNARLKGGLDAYLGDLRESTAGGRKNRSGAGGAAEAPAPPNEHPVPSTKLDRAILTFLERRGPSASEKILAGLPLKTAAEQLDRRLEALQRAGLIYEPSSGKYAKVP